MFRRLPLSSSPTYRKSQPTTRKWDREKFKNADLHGETTLPKSTGSSPIPLFLSFPFRARGGRGRRHTHTAQEEKSKTNPV